MTIKEIAKLAGVSISTVSKIMNHKDSSISPKTRERVLNIVKEFNYSPYSNTISSVGKTFLLGVLISSQENNRTLNGIIEAARERGYTVLVAKGDGTAESELKGIAALCHHHVDAVLWEPLNAESLHHADSFQAVSIPYILFHSSLKNCLNINFEQIGYQAALALIQSGHRNIACLLSPGMRTESFFNGYKKCLFDAEIPYQENMVFHDINPVLTQKITSHSITGIVVSHFTTALQFYGNINSLHCHIPYDVSMIALRNDARENIDFPQISTFTIPYFEYGQHLGQQIIQHMECNEPVQPFEFPVSLDSSVSIDIPFTRQQKKLLVVGSINMDNYLKVDDLPVTGRTVLSSNSSVYPGGKGINQAIGASKLGSRVALIGMVGSDLDSDLIFSSLDENSIDASGVRRCANTATGKAYIFVQKDGNSMISILSGANNHLRTQDILYNEQLFKNTSYCLIQTEVPQDALVTAGHLAHKYGAKVILKPSACPALKKELLDCADIIIPNSEEANILCPHCTLSEQADYFLSAGIETVIITLGANGCYAKTGQWEEYFSAASFPAIDNTGSGDAFICALAVYLQLGYPLKNAIKIATYAAGFSVSREGVTPSLIDRNTLESYVAKTEPELLSF